MACWLAAYMSTVSDLFARIPRVNNTAEQVSSFTSQVCVTAGSIEVAANLISQTNGYFGWVLFCDDDAYVLPDNVQRFLADHDPSIPTLFAIFACGTGNCDYGVCGGGGWIMSASLVRLMVEGFNKTTYRSFRQEFMHLSNEDCRMTDDVTVSQMARRMNIPSLKMVPLEGVYPW